MPVAQKSGKKLATRVHARLNSKSETDLINLDQMDYNFIPTTVFSANEYSFVGLSEEEAIEKYGADNIEVYHRETTQLERSIYPKNKRTAYMKVIVTRDESELILGMHYIGPSAGEVISGFALAMKLGMKKKLLDDSLGIHPTVSEDFFNLDVTKRSGEEYRKTEC